MCLFRCLTGSYDRTCRVWDVEKGEEMLSLDEHQNVVFSVAFNSTGDRILTGSFDKTAKIWDSITGACLWTLWGHNEEVKQRLGYACGVLRKRRGS